jgi:hypothetical protein
LPNHAHNLARIFQMQCMSGVDVSYRPRPDAVDALLKPVYPAVPRAFSEQQPNGTIDSAQLFEVTVQVEGDR